MNHILLNFYAECPHDSHYLHFVHFGTGADLEGGVGGQIRGSGDGSPLVGSRGEALAGGLGDGVPQKLEHLKKYTT